MGVRRPRKDHAEQTGVEHVLRIGKILRDLLLNRSSLLLPERFRVERVAHPHGLDIESDFKITGGNGKKILRHRLLGSGVEVAAHGGDEV